MKEFSLKQQCYKCDFCDREQQAQPGKMKRSNAKHRHPQKPPSFASESIFSPRTVIDHPDPRNALRTQKNAKVKFKEF